MLSDPFSGLIDELSLCRLRKRSFLLYRDVNCMIALAMAMTPSIVEACIRFAEPRLKVGDFRRLIAIAWLVIRENESHERGIGNHSEDQTREHDPSAA